MLTKLRPIRALNFPDTTPGGETEAMPRLAMMSPTDLLIDESYQRDLSQRSMRLIRRIVAEWSWRAFKPPVVVTTDAGCHVIDGQHTAIAAATHPDVTEIPVLIVQADDQQSRADSFVRHNRDRLTVTGMQLHHALVAAGDENAVTIQQVCDRAGARVLRFAPGNDRWQIGDTMAIEVLRSLVHRRHAKGAREVLQVCVDGRMAPVSAAALKAVEHILYAPEFAGQVHPDDVATTIRELGARADREAALFAAQFGVQRWRALATILFRNTKKGRSNGRRAAA